MPEELCLDFNGKRWNGAAIPEIANPGIDNLRDCTEHKKPINNCAECWPLYLKELARLCWNYHLYKKQMESVKNAKDLQAS